MAVNYNTSHRMKRPRMLFYCSNLPYYSMMFLAVLFILLLFTKLANILFVLNINFGVILTWLFEPLLIGTIILTTIISITVYILFFIDLTKRKDINNITRKEWKKRFIYTSILVTSFYYDFKYVADGKQFLLENFVKKSRDRLTGNYST